MQYFVIGPDGQKFGPADINTLTQWAMEGRLTPGTMLEDEFGKQIPASELPGVFPPGMPPPQMSPPQESGQPGQSPYYRGAPVGTDDGQKDITQAFIFAALSFLCCPIIFGILGIMASNRAKAKGHPQAQTALILSIVGLVCGIGFQRLAQYVGHPPALRLLSPCKDRTRRFQPWRLQLAGGRAKL